MSRLLLALLFSLPLSAQPANLLPLDNFLQDWKISRQFTIAVAEKMPAEFYGFKATPEERSFGEQMIHIAGSLFSRFKEKRGLYAGCVGYFSAAGEMDTCIVLRTALVKNGTMYVQAGAGIVADSDPGYEQTECINKAKALFRAAEEARRFASAATRGQ